MELNQFLMLQNYFANTPHEPSCRIAHNLKNMPLGVGEVRLVRIEQPINSTHHLEMLKWAKASAADSQQENDVVVTGLFCQCNSQGTYALLEADGSQLSMYTGTELCANTSTDQLYNMSIIGIVLQKKLTIRKFVHKSKKLVIKKQPKKLKRQKSTQKPFDPLSYTVRRSSGRKTTTVGMSRAMHKLSGRQTPYSSIRTAALTNGVIDHNADEDNRHPVSCHSDGVLSNINVPTIHNSETKSKDGGGIADAHQDGSLTSCRQDQKAATATDKCAVNHDVIKDNRHPVSCHDDAVLPNAVISTVQNADSSVEEARGSAVAGNDGSATSCQHDRNAAKSATSRSQNKSPPRSAPSDSIPKKIRSPDLPVIQVGLISLFDGIGSVLPTFISRLQAYPKVFIAAECEEENWKRVAQFASLPESVYCCDSWLLHRNEQRWKVD